MTAVLAEASHVTPLNLSLMRANTQAHGEYEAVIGASLLELSRAGMQQAPDAQKLLLLCTKLSQRQGKVRESYLQAISPSLRRPLEFFRGP